MKVLVLCQRKKGMDSLMRRVEDTVVPKINSMVFDYFKSDVDITYLSDTSLMSPGSVVDYDFKLDDNKETRNFIKFHDKSFSMIIMNTCPLSMINLKYVVKLLTTDGVVVVANYPDNLKSQGIQILKYLEPLNKYFTMIDNDKDYFLYESKSPTLKTSKSPTSKSPTLKTLKTSKSPSKSPTLKTLKTSKSPTSKSPSKSPTSKSPSKSPTSKTLKTSKSPTSKSPSKSPTSKSPEIDFKDNCIYYYTEINVLLKNICKKSLFDKLCLWKIYGNNLFNLLKRRNDIKRNRNFIYEIYAILEIFSKYGINHFKNIRNFTLFINHSQNLEEIHHYLRLMINLLVGYSESNINAMAE